MGRRRFISPHVSVCCAWPIGSTVGIGAGWFFNAAFVLIPFSGLAVSNHVMPLLGVVFLPTATLGFCWATASFGGLSSFSGILIVAIGAVIDLGLIGNGRGIAKR